MSLYRGAGGASDATDDSTVNAVAGYASSAASSATNAASSATSASTSASSASTSATNAAASATLASTRASNAQTSATQAAGYATDASNEADDAAASALIAYNSANDASTYSSNALGYKNSASSFADAAAASASSAASSATSAAASVSDAQALYGGAAALSNAVTAAAGSATSAASSASTATTKAGEASDSAIDAAASAVSASSFATASQVAANASQAYSSAAEAARDATLAAYDSFDDRYLGVKSADPTEDNDGNALVPGSLYFNDQTHSMKLYTGTAWVDAYVSGNGFLVVNNNLSDLQSASTARTNLGLGTAATTASSDYATAAQGVKADSAIQAADLGTAAYTASSDYATAAQGTKADSAVQPNTSPTFTGATFSGGTANGVTYLNGSKVLTTGSALTFDGTNLGVNSPILAARTLSVKGRAAFTATANDSQLAIFSDGSTNGLYSTYNTTGSYLPMTFWINDAEQMRLTSTGLGIGTSSPSYKLHVLGSASSTVSLFEASTTDAYIGLKNTGVTGYVGLTNAGNFIWQTPSSSYATKLTLDNVGNLGLGVTPSAWTGGTPRIFQFGPGGSLGTNSAQDNAFMGANWYYNAGDKYLGNGYATEYRQNAGTHAWYIAANNTSGAGASLSFTQAMTLDASGNLLVGGTSNFRSARFTSTATNYAVNTDFYSPGSNKLSKITLSNDDDVLAIAANSSALCFYTSGGNTERARIDSSGNLGLGVTPSAWGSSNALQVGPWASLSSANAYGTGIGFNNFYNGTNHIYSFSNAATKLELGAGVFKFFTAPSGTAGDAISFTQAMTLDASGNLSVGTTAAGTNGKVYVYEPTVARLFLTDSTLGTAYGGQVRGLGVVGAGGNISIGTVDANVYNEGIRVLNQATAIQFYTNNGANGSTAERARIDSSGNLQVSNLAGTGNRAVYSTSTGILTNSSSDRSLKENDAPISQGLDAVLAMRPVSFEWVDKDKMGAQREIGFIAQEMQQIVPEVVGSNSDETLSIDYPKLVAVMAKAIQELTDRVKVLEAK